MLFLKTLLIFVFVFSLMGVSGSYANKSNATNWSKISSNDNADFYLDWKSLQESDGFVTYKVLIDKKSVQEDFCLLSDFMN